MISYKINDTSKIQININENSLFLEHNNMSKYYLLK